MRAALAAMLLLAAAVSAPQPTSAVSQYRDLLVTYRENPGAALERLVTLSDRDFDIAIADATSPRPATPWSVQDLQTAALMQTDAGALLLVQQHDRHGGAQVLRGERFIARVLEISPPQVWFVQRWYYYSGQLLEENNAGTDANALEQRSRFLPGYQASRAAIEGLTAEYRTCQRSGGGFRGRFQAIGRENMFEGDFLQAVNLFESALKSDPRLLVAVLHLGRIQMLTGNDTRAKALFEKAAGAPDASVYYLANLFLGSLAERADSLTEAERRYRLAAARLPGSQTANLALANLLDRTGRAAEARQTMDALLEWRAHSVVFDPWWIYLSQDEPLSQLNALRTDVVP